MPPLNVLENKLSQIGNLTKIDDLNNSAVQEQLGQLCGQYSTVHHGHDLAYLLGNLPYKGPTYFFENTDIATFPIINQEDDIQLFAPRIKQRLQNCLQQLASICTQSGLGLSIIHTDNEMANEIRSVNPNEWELLERSKAEVVYDNRLLNDLPGKKFANLRNTRNKLLDREVLDFSEAKEIDPINQILEVWNQVQGSKYERDRQTQEQFVATKIIERKLRDSTLPLSLILASLEGNPIGYSIFSQSIKSPEWGIIHTLKAINKSEFGGIRGASDALYLKVFRLLKEQGVNYINDGEIGTEPGTISHKLSFAPIKFLTSFDLKHVIP